MKENEEAVNKIIKFPVKNENTKTELGKKKGHKKRIKRILAILGIIVPIIIAGITSIIQIKLNEKSEIESKPILDFSIEYFEDDFYEDIYLYPEGKYLSKVTINMSEKNDDPVNVSIEPFFNILYFDKQNKGLVKQLLPIHDLKGLYEPMTYEVLNVKNGSIYEIKYNKNTYEIIKQINNMFKDHDEIDYKNFKEEFCGLTIMSIDLEFYITIDYLDIYQNEYTEVYLCRTGFGKPSCYLNAFTLDEKNAQNDDLVKFMLECQAIYYKLKLTAGESIGFEAKLTKITTEDEMYKDFHQNYTSIIETPGSIYYVPNFLTDLDELISLQFEHDQLVFCLLSLYDIDDIDDKKKY